MHYIGFDYGTSHCAAGLATPAGVRMATLDDGGPLLPSMLWAPDVRFDLPLDAQGRIRTESDAFLALRFGSQALADYLRAPSQGYFVKSPKSFLGAPGLLPVVRERFERVVGAMMACVRLRAERSLGVEIRGAVIGRPVNFQGPVGAVENEQALEMLRHAAHLAGFTDISFLFEPLAAALEYEAQLTRDERVLVVDVGGGTTDCSLVAVGPGHRAVRDREADMLGHSGERLGGNDYDQALALVTVVPRLGWQGALRSGLPVPNHYLVDAFTINDVNAQARFYSAGTGERLEQLRDDALEPRGLDRLLALQQGRGTYRLLREVEQAKIDLSREPQAEIALDFLEQGLAVSAHRSQFDQACARLRQRLQYAVAALRSAARPPDLVYLTGGMAQSPVVRTALAEVLGHLPVRDSDHFTSVTEGLALWARHRHEPAA